MAAVSVGCSRARRDGPPLQSVTPKGIGSGRSDLGGISTRGAGAGQGLARKVPEEWDAKAKGARRSGLRLEAAADAASKEALPQTERISTPQAHLGERNDFGGEDRKNPVFPPRMRTFNRDVTPCSRCVYSNGYSTDWDRSSRQSYSRNRSIL